MRVDESDRELAKREQEFVESFKGKQRRVPGNHPAKTLSDVNMETNQPVYIMLPGKIRSLVESVFT